MAASIEPRELPLPTAAELARVVLPPVDVRPPLSLPMAASAFRVTSEYGQRVHPVTGAPKSFHGGIDLGAPEGTPVLAAAAGRVTGTGRDATRGNWIQLTHDGGLATTYMHLSRVLVTQGEPVAAGQTIGAVGRTGRATGAHLHFAVALGGRAVDPRPYLFGNPSMSFLSGLDATSPAVAVQGVWSGFTFTADDGRVWRTQQGTRRRTRASMSRNRVFANGTSTAVVSGPTRSRLGELDVAAVTAAQGATPPGMDRSLIEAIASDAGIHVITHHPGTARLPWLT